MCGSMCDTRALPRGSSGKRTGGGEAELRSEALGVVEIEGDMLGCAKRRVTNASKA